MTGRKRLLTTFDKNVPDRIPVSPFFFTNNVYEMFDYVPTIDNHFDPDDFDLVSGFVDYAQKFGFDIMHPLGLRWDRYIPDSNENWDVSILEKGEGDEIQKIWTVKTPSTELRQVINFRRSSKYLIVFAQEEYLIKTKEDFEAVQKYMPSPNFIDCNIVERAKQAVGDSGIVNPATHGAFNTLNQFRKLDDMMMDPVVDESFYQEMMDFFLEWNLKQLKRCIEAGADSVELGGNLATSSVGPDFFSHYVLPYEKRLNQGIHETDCYIVYHNCGDAAKIMHLYNDLGIDCWGYLTTPPYGDNDLDSALRTIDTDIRLRGNIDQVEFLRKATPAQVTEKVKNLIDKVLPEKRWILSTTDFFFDGTPYENIEAFSEAGIEYGKY
jgi:hypothetical protein